MKSGKSPVVKPLYLLDTNICIYAINMRSKSVVEKVRQRLVDEIAISSVTVAELEYGLQKSSRKTATRAALIEFLAPFAIIDFTSLDAAEYGKIRAFLEEKGTPIGAYDLQIAAQALARGLVLVSNNEREFSRVPQLKLENWAD